MYWDHMTGWGWGMMVFWTVLWVALVAAVIWVVGSLLRRRQPPTVTESRRSAREILDERLARGEIDSSEYDRLRDRLDATAAPRHPKPA